MPSEQELLPCPFCGSVAHVDYHGLEQTYSVTCGASKCQATIPYVGLTEAEAIAAWNTRPHSNQMDGDKALIALRAARQFIANGVEFGYIRMPDADTPDSAHDTPGLIDEAIASLTTPAPDKALMPEAAVGEALQKALEFAVLTLAFHGRDRGTERQEKMLDDLEELAREVDPLIRAVIASTPTPVEEPANAATGESALRFILDTMLHSGGAISRGIVDSDDRVFVAYDDVIAAMQSALAATNAGQVEAETQVAVWEQEWLRCRDSHWGDEIPWPSAYEIARRLDALTNGQATGESK